MTEINPALLAANTYCVLPGVKIPLFPQSHRMTIGALIQRTPKEVRDSPKFGRHSYKHLVDALAKHGLRLGMNLPERTYEMSKLDLADIASRLATATRIRSDNASIRARLNFLYPHPVYGTSINALINLGRLFKETVLRVEFDPGYGLWCDAEISYQNYIDEIGYMRLEKELASVSA